jgi:hypothetical protein
LVRSWTRWRSSRILRQQAKAEKRLILLQVETDRQLLRVKELRQLQESLQHRQQELASSESWHRMQARALVTLPTSNPTGPPPSKDSRSDRPTS